MFDVYLVLPRMHLFGNDVMVYVDFPSEETHYVSVPAFTFVTSLCDCWAKLGYHCQLYPLIKSHTKQ